MAKRKKAVLAAASGRAEPSVGEPSAADIAKVQHLAPIQIPEWYAAGIRLIMAGNDVQLIFTKPVLLGDPNSAGGQAENSLALLAPVGIVRMSRSTLKDISVLLGNQMTKLEKESGVIETDYTRRLAELAAAAKKSGSAKKKR